MKKVVLMALAAIALAAPAFAGPPATPANAREQLVALDDAQKLAALQHAGAEYDRRCKPATDACKKAEMDDEFFSESAGRLTREGIQPNATPNAIAVGTALVDDMLKPAQ